MVVSMFAVSTLRSMMPVVFVLVVFVLMRSRCRWFLVLSYILAIAVKHNGRELE